jgi:hypothetical protein
MLSKPEADAEGITMSDTVIGTLTVNLEANTAKFEGDLGKASGKAEDFGKRAEGAGRRVSGGMRESNEAVIALGETFGVRLPSSITRTIAGLDSVGPALAAALPFAALAVGAVMFIEHLKKVREEAEKLAQDQSKFGLTAQEAFNTLDDKMLEAEKKADELRGEHLAALRKELELIDHASMKDLAAQFDTLAKSAEATFVDLKANFLETTLGLSKGSEGAAHALTLFEAQYRSLLAQGKDKEAGDLLAGTLDSAKKAYDLMYASQEGHGSDAKELQAQQQLIDLLEDEVKLRQKSVDVANQDKANARTEENQREVKQLADLHELIAKAKAKLNEEMEKDANETGKIMGSRLRDGLTSELKSAEDAAKQTLENIEQKFAVAEEPQLSNKSNAQLGLDQLDNNYKLGLVTIREYVTQKRDLLKQAGDADVAYATLVKQEADLEKSVADNGTDAAAQISALHKQEEAQRALNKAITDQRIAMQNVEAEAAKMEHTWADYFGKMKAETSQLSLTVRTQLQGSMEQAMNSTNQAFAKSIVEGKNFGQARRQVGVQFLESWIEVLMKWLEQWIIAHTIGDAISSTSAATQAAQNRVVQTTSAGLAGANMMATVAAAPFPIDLTAPALAAEAFTQAMAFEQGGEIPGTGAVPIIGHGGETVVTKALTDRVERAEANGNGGDTHVHFAPQVHALDAAGVDKVLEKHQDKFHKAVKNYQRRHGK